MDRAVEHLDIRVGPARGWIARHRQEDVPAGGVEALAAGNVRAADPEAIAARGVAHVVVIADVVGGAAPIERCRPPLRVLLHVERHGEAGPVDIAANPVQVAVARVAALENSHRLSVAFHAVAVVLPLRVAIGSDGPMGGVPLLDVGSPSAPFQDT